MKTTTLTSKGQLVIPKSVREALHVRPGTRFSVALEGDRIILEPTTTKTRRLSDWPPALQVRRRLIDPGSRVERASRRLYRRIAFYQRTRASNA